MEYIINCDDIEDETIKNIIGDAKTEWKEMKKDEL